jgi:hypothetical protein
MAFPDLIHTPAYQRALNTPSVMDRAPASDWAAREPHLLYSYQIRKPASGSIIWFGMLWTRTRILIGLPSGCARQSRHLWN